MASLEDLKHVKKAPATLTEWLAGFNDEDRDLVVHAILTGDPRQVYGIVSQLDENPYPFELETINHHRRKLAKGN